MAFREVNFDGLPGPTHNYAGLSPGNLASISNAGRRSHPKQAALQGLAKMRALLDMGLAQGVLPPHERPHLPTLRRGGFLASDVEIIERAGRESPNLLANCYSAAAMWAANAATVSPAPDTADARTHFTPANLVANIHRAIEAPVTTRILRAIFHDESRFVVHDPLPSVPFFGDEGAANHTRLGTSHSNRCVEFFVYGRTAALPDGVAPDSYPARQTFEASSAIARRHQLDPSMVLITQQNPALIDTGVFHNDVICVGNLQTLLYHQDAFLNTAATIDALDEMLAGELIHIEIKSDELSVEEAVRTYLFNSQIVTLPSGEMTIIAPAECVESDAAARVLARICDSINPITSVRYLDLRESMRNGGGPACLRLRVALDEYDLARVTPNVLLTPELHDRLVEWVDRHYRDTLDPTDLADPHLYRESSDALDELTRILAIGDIYRFQVE